MGSEMCIRDSSDILERLFVKVHGKVHDTHTRALYDLIRISLGLEDKEDLIADISNALDAIRD